MFEIANYSFKKTCAYLFFISEGIIIFPKCELYNFCSFLMLSDTFLPLRKLNDPLRKSPFFRSAILFWYCTRGFHTRHWSVLFSVKQVLIVRVFSSNELLFSQCRNNGARNVDSVSKQGNSRRSEVSFRRTVRIGKQYVCHATINTGP